MALRTKAQFDPFDGRSVRIKTNAELSDGLKRVAALRENACGEPAHVAMWSAILAEIKSEIIYRAKREPIDVQ